MLERKEFGFFNGYKVWLFTITNKNGASVTPDGAEPVDRCASACARACMVALEDKVGNRFEAKFRKRSVWQRGIHGESLISGNQFTGGRCPDKFEGK